MASRNGQITNLRVLAILSVVIGHSCIIYSSGWDTYTTSYNSAFFAILKEVINRYQMALFFAVSGYLFFYTAERYTFSKFISKKAIRLLLPFICVGLLWLIPVRLIAHYPNFSTYKDGIESFILMGDAGHLWFLPALFWVFVISYLFTSLLCRRKYGNVFYLIISGVCLLVAKQYNLPFYLGDAMGHLLYFAMGYTFCRFAHSYLSLRRYSYGKCLMIGMSILSAALLIGAIGFSGTLGKVLNILSSMFLVILFFQFVSPNTGRLTEFIDRNSMGIYLFHSPVIYVLYDHFSNVMPPITMVSVNFLVSILVSIIITKILREVKLGILIGE